MRLKELRKRNDSLRRSWPKPFGLKRTRIAAYETGVNNPEYAVLLRLADYFHVTLDYLTGRSDTPEVTLTEEENQILLLLRRLSPGERAALLRLLEATLERQSR